jgi:hypothetical protein
VQALQLAGMHEAVLVEVLVSLPRRDAEGDGASGPIRLTQTFVP